MASSDEDPPDASAPSHSSIGSIPFSALAELLISEANKQAEKSSSQVPKEDFWTNATASRSSSSRAKEARESTNGSAVAVASGSRAESSHARPSPAHPHIYPDSPAPTASTSSQYLVSEPYVEPVSPATPAGSPPLEPQAEPQVPQKKRYSNIYLKLVLLRSSLRKAIENTFQDELTRRLIVTVLLLTLSRAGYFLLLPGFDRSLIPSTMFHLQAGERPSPLLLPATSGLVQRPLLGISPYILSGTVIQFLVGSKLFPYFERLKNEGSEGHEKIKTHIRSSSVEPGAVREERLRYYLMTAVLLTFGAWLLSGASETITKEGFVSKLHAAGLVLGPFLVMTSAAVLLTTAVRNEPLDYFEYSEADGSRRQRQASVHLSSIAAPLPSPELADFDVSRALIDASRCDPPWPATWSTPAGRLSEHYLYSYIPFSVVPDGMMPVLGASMLLSTPNFLCRIFTNETCLALARALSPSTGLGGGALYYGFMFLLIAFFNSADISDMPKELGQHLVRIGARIPGVQPGTATIEHLRLAQTSARFVGGLLLGMLAVVSGVVDHKLSALFQGANMGFTHMLIIVTPLPPSSSPKKRVLSVSLSLVSAQRPLQLPGLPPAILLALSRAAAGLRRNAEGAARGRWRGSRGTAEGRRRDFGGNAGGMPEGLRRDAGGDARRAKRAGSSSTIRG
eukprot:jgi/Mesen1/3606/ME000020S03133